MIKYLLVGAALTAAAAILDLADFLTIRLRGFDMAAVIVYHQNNYYRIL